MENHQCKITQLYKYHGVDIYTGCNMSPSNKQYAAIDAYINNLELPLISDQSFSDTTSIPHFCIKPDDALELSITAIIGTYTKVSDIIFFIPDNKSMPAYLERITEIKSNKFPGNIISVCKDKNNNIFKVKSYNTGIIRYMDENSMISLIGKLINNNRSMTFYIDTNLSFYSVQLHNNTKSLWITNNSDSDPVQFVGSCASVIMPMLYSTPCATFMLRLNIGAGQIESQKLNLIQSKINAVNASILSAMSKDNLCYCCAYMKRIHSVLCHHKLRSSVSFETDLLTQFIDEIK